jgi:gas vesicle protein
MTQQEQQGNFGVFVFGFLVGAGVGAAVALFKTPRSGQETRRKLRRTAQELRKEADSVVSTTQSHVQEAKEELAQHAAEIKAEGETALEETKGVLKEGVQDVQQEAQESAENVRETAQSA